MPSTTWTTNAISIPTIRNSARCAPWRRSASQSILTWAVMGSAISAPSLPIRAGRVRSRSEASILAEAEKLTRLPDFKGYILDLGGPTANMYGIECSKKLQHGSCRKQRCLSPQVCSSLKPSHERQLALLEKIGLIPGVKKVFIASGIRHDLIMSDRRFGLPYLKELVSHHISGQLKLAPEHTVDRILSSHG